MTVNIINGKEIATIVSKNLTKSIVALKKDRQIIPGLAVVLVRNDSASKIYVRNKEKACEKIGIYSKKYVLSKDTTENELLSLIDKLNNDDKIHGILVQLPLPKQIDEQKIIEAISPQKDVDGFHPYNIGKLTTGDPTFIPCTPYGIIKMLEYSNIEMSGKNVVVIGRSNIVGKPISLLLLQKNATVTICHSRTKSLTNFTKNADILIVAIGQAKKITGDMIKPGAVVIDVGINKIDGKIVGDVDFDSAKEIASAISPVPGGVGPMTIAMLMSNTIDATKKILNVN